MAEWADVDVEKSMHEVQPGQHEVAVGRLQRLLRLHHLRGYDGHEMPALSDTKHRS